MITCMKIMIAQKKKYNAQFLDNLTLKNMNEKKEQ